MAARARSVRPSLTRTTVAAVLALALTGVFAFVALRARARDSVLMERAYAGSVTLGQARQLIWELHVDALEARAAPTPAATAAYAGTRNSLLLVLDSVASRAAPRDSQNVTALQAAVDALGRIDRASFEQAARGERIVYIAARRDTAAAAFENLRLLEQAEGARLADARATMLRAARLRWTLFSVLITALVAAALVFLRVAWVTDRERQLIEAQLQEQSRELERSNRELEQFASVASHDLHEPLRVIVSFANLLSERAQGKLDAADKDFISYIRDSAERLQTLVSDLLEYARIHREADRAVHIDLNAAVADVLNELGALLRDAGATVRVHELPAVQGDPVLVRQLLRNLVANAIRFRSAQPLEIEIAGSNDHSRARFSVRDNGIGIEPQHAQDIFEPFRRLHGRSQYPGSGMGLALCRKIVAAHGGAISVESDGKSGSTFYVTLPAALAPASAR
ncbi:MAG: sensor histidine kinase [Gemmatimonadaceae bacterium]